MMATQLSFDIHSDPPLDYLDASGTCTRLTQRDLDLMVAILRWGGVLTTVQLAVLFWPPDLRRRLASWRVSPADIVAWLEHVPTRELYCIMEVLKWGLHLNRVRRTQRKTDEGLRAWLREQREHNPAAFAELERFMDEVAAVPPATWLAQAVARHLSPPALFATRPRHPSEFVSSACKHRLRLLADLGLLEAYEQATRLSEGRAQTCWFLSREGRNLLAQMWRVRAKELDWRAAGAYGLLHLNHRLLLNDVRISLTLACRQTGHRLVEWIDDNQLRRRLAQAKVTLRRRVRDAATGETVDKEETHTLRLPDGYFVLELATGEVRHCFLELDNQTLTLNYSQESVKDFAHKIRTLSAFYRGGGYKASFPEAGESMWYLTVTSGGDRRVANLKATAERVLGAHNRAADRYWFTSLADLPAWEDYYAEGAFAPVWLRGGQERRWRLDEGYAAEGSTTPQT